MRLLLAVMTIALAGTLSAQQLTEGFEAGTPPTGWFMQNNSTLPVGAQPQWFAGGGGPFTAHQGAEFAAANFNATGGTVGTEILSCWLVTPAVQLANGQVITFWTRTVTGTTFPDRMQVRLNPTNTTNVGTSPTDVGDFTELLLDINPTYVTSAATAYPEVWTQFAISVTGVTGTVTGRIAFRYFVENGGPQGANSNYIGVDSVEIGDVPDDPEVDVQKPLGVGNTIPSGSTYDYENPLVPGSATNAFDFDIVNQGASQDLTISGFTTSNAAGCAVTTTTGPSSPVAPGNNTNVALNIDLTGFATAGLYSFDVNFTTNDADETNYTFTVQGSRGMSGALTINNGGGGDYTDFGAAFDDLEDLGIVGNVTFTVFDNGSGYASNASYELGSDGGITTPAPVLGSGANSITFVAATGASPAISGNFPINLFGAPNFAIVTMALTDVANITFEGITFTGTSDANLLVYQDPVFPGGTVNISRCRFYGNISGMAVAALANSQALTGFNFENNFIYDCGPTGSAFTVALSIPQYGMLSLFNPDATCNVEHNTFLLTNFGFPTADAACYSITGGLSALGSVNYNIFYTLAPNTKLVSIPTGLEPLASDYNIYYYPPGQATFSTNYASLATWQAGTTLDPNSLDSDPALANVTAGSVDLHLTGTSPAIEAAVGSTATIDYDGDPRPMPAATTNDIGADETALTGGGGGPGTLLINNPASLPNGSESAAYGPITVTATGGTTPYEWTATGLPAGVTIDLNTGTISGTPTASGTFNVTVTVTDAGTPQQSDDQAYTFDVVPAGTLIITTPASLPGGTQGQAYSTNITAIDGVGNHTWSIVSGSLPAGITLGSSTSGTVALSGTPTVSGTFLFTVQVTDSDTPAETDTQAFSLVLAPGSLPGSTSGGSGGGGGCVADAGTSHWLALVGLLAMLGVVGTLRTRKS